MAILHTDRQGVFVLMCDITEEDEGGGQIQHKYRYVCNSATIFMKMDSLPVAKLTIAGGVSMQYGALPASERTYANDIVYEQDPETLLASVLKNRANNYTQMIPCTLFEIVYPGDEEDTVQRIETPVFKGAVMSGSMRFSAGVVSEKELDIVCIHEAVLLNASPLPLYATMPGSAFVDALYSVKGINIDKYRKNWHVYTSGYCNVTGILQKAGIWPDIQNKTIFEIIDGIVSAIYDAVEYKDVAKETSSGSQANTPPRSRLGEYIYSTYTLIDTSSSKDSKGYKFNSASKDLFAMSICAYFLQAMKNTSILDAIIRILNTEEYMLNIIPRWSDVGFKLEIAPNQAWAGNVDKDTELLELFPDDILSITTNYSPVDSIHHPDAFIVNFSPAIAYGAEIASMLAGVAGAYSKNQTVREQLSKRYTQGVIGTADNATDAEKDAYKLLTECNVRATMHNAPTWLYPEAFIEQRKDADTNNTTQVNAKKVELPSDSKQAAESAEKQQEARLKSKNEICKVADKIAEALYAFTYGAADSANLSINPDIRFGRSELYAGSMGICLEKNIGNRIKINLGTESTLSFIGMLESVRYSCTAGASSSVSYDIKVSRIRPAYDKEPFVNNFSLYTKIKKGSQNASSNPE